MRFLFRILVLVLFLAFASSCAYQPRSMKDSAEMAEVRSEYVQNNPEGKFNHYIEKGELSKGMSVIEVLAAWGLPNMRQSWQNTDKESWTYHSFDPHTGDYTIVDLTFEARTLLKWVRHRQVAAAGGNPLDNSLLPPKPADASGAGTSGSPKKK